MKNLKKLTERKKLPFYVFESVEYPLERKEIFQCGQNLVETLTLPVKYLLPFFERDFFLEKKEEDLCNISVRFYAREDNSRPVTHIVAIIEESDKNIFRQKFLKRALSAKDLTFVRQYQKPIYLFEGRIILGKIAQILWSYNFCLYNWETDQYHRRFTYDIIPSPHLIFKWAKKRRTYV